LKYSRSAALAHSRTIGEIIEHVREDVSTIDERKRDEILSSSPAWKSVDTRV
jgi:hypothetical protein